MAIYIKGVAKWNNCGECQFCHTENFTHWCCPTDREDILYDAIPEWCPLVYIPKPHGRLIDERVAYDKIAEQETGYYMDMDGVDRGLQDTPTVIEGSGE